MKNESIKRNAAVVALILAGLSSIAWLLWRKTDDKPVPKDLASPRLVVQKSARKLLVYDGEKLVKTFKIVLGFAPVGDKIKRDDGRTPEGDYVAVVKNPKSKFHRSFGLNYPNNKDAERGLRDKLISQLEYDAILKANQAGEMPPQDTALGSEIYVHGGGIAEDWTFGCVALRDEQIEEIFDALPSGIIVQIQP